MSAITLDEMDAGTVQGALDSLALSLSEHDHFFTEGERIIYERATELLGTKPVIQFVKRDDNGNLTGEAAEYE